MNLFLFIMFFGLVLGGLFVAEKERFWSQKIIFLIPFFGLVCYIGMIVGMILPSWFSVKLITYLLSVITLIFFIACITRYHPAFGFFHKDIHIHLFLLALI